MGAASGISGGAAAQWYRFQAVSRGCLGGTADRDYASVLPAVLNAARHRRPFIAGWLSRGGGAPLELITNAGPLPPAGSGAAGGRVFPWAARGVPADANMLADLDELVWAACPGRQVPVSAGAEPARPDQLPTLF